MNRKTTRLLVLPLAGLAVSAVAGVGLSSSAMAATPATHPLVSVTSAAHGASATDGASTAHGDTTTHDRKGTGGGSLKSSVLGTSMTMTFWNNTDQNLHLIYSNAAYGSWDQAPPQTVAPHAGFTVKGSNSSLIHGTQIVMTYQMDDGTQASVTGYQQPSTGVSAGLSYTKQSTSRPNQWTLWSHVNLTYQSPDGSAALTLQDASLPAPPPVL